MINRLTKGAFAALTAAMLLLPFDTVHAGIPVGTWKSHPAYNNATFSLEAFSHIYVLSDGALYFYDPADEGLYTIDRTGGLSDTDIARIAYFDSEKVLLLVYSNGNIDILYENETVYNFTDLKNGVDGNMSVNDVCCIGNMAYISTSAGLVVFDVKRREINNTYTFDSPANTVVIFSDTIICGTDNGMYLGHTNDNLLDPSNWKMFRNIKFRNLFTFDGQLMGRSYDNRVWTINKLNAGFTNIMDSVNGLSVDKSGKLILIQDTVVNLFDNLSNRKRYVLDSHINHIMTKGNTWWASQGLDGLCRYELRDSIVVTKATNIKPNSPRRNLFNFISWPEEGKMLSVSGCPNYQNIFYPGSIMVYQNGRWSYFDEDIKSKTGLNYVNLSTVVQDPNDENHYFAGSMRQGLYEFKDGKFFKLHTWNNSPLRNIIDIDRFNFVSVECLAYDKEGNLWMTNNEVDTVINVLQPNRKWFKLYYPEMAKVQSFKQMTFDENGYLWMIASRGNNVGLYCLDTNGTPSKKSDDKLKYSGSVFTNQDGTSEEIFDIYFYQTDLDGQMWIGTNRGIFVLKEPSEFISSQNVVFERIKIARNDGSDLADYLFSGVMTTAIYIDQGNRKWIGTLSDGIFLLSPDGTKVLEHFTSINSPLPSDNILSISENGLDGSVFIGTDKGMVEYGGMARDPENDLYKSNILVYPNPVKPDFDGYVTITGLTSNSSVRIVNSSGRLIHQSTSNGGQYSWNLNDYNGKPVPSGIYHAIITNLENNKSESTSITVIR